MVQFNNDIVDDLLKYITESDYNQLLTDFIEELKGYQTIINFSSYKKDSQSVIRAVHSIKGSAASVGLSDFSEEAKILESYLKSDTNVEKPSIFECFETSLQEVIETLSTKQCND